MATTRVRRRLLVVTTEVKENGQFEPLELRLPDSAQRITGIAAVAAQMPGQLYQRQDAFVLYGPLPGGNDVFSAQIPVPGANPARSLPVRQLLGDPELMAAGIADYDPARHVGFYQNLSDEVPQQLLNVPDGMVVFYAHNVTLGVPRILDSDFKELKLIREPGHEIVETMFTQFVGSATNPTAIPSTLAYLCRVETPPPGQGWQANSSVTGYSNGIYFPGDPDRYSL